MSYEAIKEQLLHCVGSSWFSGVAEVHGALSEKGGLGPLVPMSMT